MYVYMIHIDKHRYDAPIDVERTAMSVPTSGRIQLALNVTDLDAAIEFYEKLFDAPPAKIREGYANFSIDTPPLKLVLIEGIEGGTINHLGVEVVSPSDVDAAAARFDVEGVAHDVEAGIACCYALQDKVWVTGPDGERWEYYTVLDDVDVMHAEDTTAACCTPSTSIDVAV